MARLTPSARADTRVPGMAQRLLQLPARLAKRVALHTVSFVVARPRLDDFLRRQVYRFPRLAGVLRGTVSDSRRSDWQSLPPAPADESELTDEALQILRELQHAIARASTPDRS